MSHNLKKVLNAVMVSAGLIICGLAIYFFAGRTITDYIFADFNYAVVCGVPANATKSGADIGIRVNNTNQEKATKENESIINKSEWVEPVIGEQYAVIKCDNIGLDVPVYYGDTDDILKKGAGQSVHSSLPGQGGAVLVGAHDTTFFASLEKMKVGDEVFLDAEYGNYKYKVDKIEVIKGSDYNLDTEGEKLLLYTCYPFGKTYVDRDQRIVFECVFVDGPLIGGDSDE